MNTTPRTRSTSTVRRRVASLSAVAVAAAAVLAAPATAGAQELSSGITAGSSEINTNARDSAWNTRNQLHGQAANLGSAAEPVQNAVDGAVNTVFPGLIAERSAADAARRAEAERGAAAAAAAAEAARFNRGSCPVTADVCVDIDGGRSWLQEGGRVVYGAVPVSSGGRGQETPRGTFTINRKVKDEISYEFGNAPMPYAMYFTYNGHAFHMGNVATTSAGCVRLNQQDAIHYFNNVHIGDVVHIY